MRSGNLPKMIAKRISMLSSNQKIFEDAIEPFERALKESGYNASIWKEKDKKEYKMQDTNGLLVQPTL